MSLRRIPLSVSQFCEQFEIDPDALHSVHTRRIPEHKEGWRFRTELEIFVEEFDRDGSDIRDIPSVD